MSLLDFLDDSIQKLVDYVMENYNEIKGNCPNTSNPANGEQCVECNSDSYFGGTPLYDCGNFKKVYLIRFLGSHTMQTHDIIKGNTITDIAKRTKLSAASLGGGPGVEAFALLAQLKKRKWNSNVVFHNIDVEDSWESIYEVLIQYFSGLVERVSIEPYFLRHDVTQSGLDLECDIIFVPWILSELGMSDRQSVLTNSRDLACSNGYVVVTDRPELDLVEKISGTISKIPGWNLIDHSEEFSDNCGIQFPDKIKEAFHVQLKYSTAYWILKKP